jgi:hypothetical protein
MRNNLDVENDATYQSVKFELEVPHIRGSTKITKSDRF